MKEDDDMGKTMTPSEMTDGQMERAIELFRAQLRKHKGKLSSDAVQIVLGQAGLGRELYAVLHNRVEALRGTVVTVDRSIPPVYPYWVECVMDPELESTSPNEYDLAKEVSLWLHANQKGHTTMGPVVYDYLKENDMLKSCLGLSDALAIQNLGVAVFRKIFCDKDVYFWKSVVRRRDSGGLFVPYLCVRTGILGLFWHRFDLDGFVDDPAVHFASSN